MSTFALQLRMGVLQATKTCFLQRVGSISLLIKQFSPQHSKISKYHKL